MSQRAISREAVITRHVDRDVLVERRRLWVVSGGRARVIAEAFRDLMADRSRPWFERLEMFGGPLTKRLYVQALARGVREEAEFRAAAGLPPDD